MKFYVVAEIREKHDNLIQGDQVYNDYVSQKSMLDLVNEIRALGYECEFLEGNEELLSFVHAHSDGFFDDCIFINYNYGVPARFKRGQCPILLEMLHMKYSGSDPLVSLLVNDKEITKKVVQRAGVNVPKSILVDKEDRNLQKKLENTLSLPLVVKPNAEGSSLGIHADSLCKDYTVAVKKAAIVVSDFREAIIEEYVPGYECTVWIVGNPGNYRIIAPLIISMDGVFYFEQALCTIEDKAAHKRKYYKPETVLPISVAESLKEISKCIFSELGMRDYGRLDFRIRGNQIYFIEANGLPIFSQTSEIGKIIELYNLTYKEICNELIQVVMHRVSGKN